MQEQQLAILKQQYQQRLGAKEQLSRQILAHEQTLHQLKSTIQSSLDVLNLLTLTSQQGRLLAKIHLEKIVSQALTFVLEEECQFLIELGESGGKPTAEFYVEMMVDEHLSRQRPQSFCGGGLVDLISATLRYAYVEIFNEPRIQNRLFILDEPGKMISKDAQALFATFIRSLSQEFDKQTLIITHEEQYAEATDQTIWISKSNSKSKVKYTS